jgi:hypothetical protein
MGADGPVLLSRVNAGNHSYGRISVASCPTNYLPYEARIFEIDDTSLFLRMRQGRQSPSEWITPTRNAAMTRL